MVFFDATSSDNSEIFITNFYNEEFDPGSGWTLAAGLIHASQGGSNATGERVRNAYVTYLLLWDNLWKQGLILDGMIDWHHLIIKEFR